MDERLRNLQRQAAEGDPAAHATYTSALERADPLALEDEGYGLGLEGCEALYHCAKKANISGWVPRR